MKTFNSTLRTVAVLTMLGITTLVGGCSQWIDSSINTDPNNPQDVPLKLILSGVEGSLAFTYGSDLSRFPSLYTQHHSGVTGQHAAYYSDYSLASNEVDNLWQNMYLGVMVNTDKMLEKATMLSSPHYRGVGFVLQAISIGMVSDCFGDAPFSTAFKGEQNLKPTFDTQDKIYASINAMLDSAIVNLAAAKSTFNPGADDLFYGGDLAKWTMTAYALKARYANHLSKRDAAASAAAALSVLSKAYASNTDDMIFTFADSPANSNPLFSFDQDRNDIRISGTFAKLLNSLQDPRRLQIGGGLKTSADSIKADNDLGPFYASSTSPIVLCSYAEMRFIEAEAKLRTGDAAGAKTAYIAAIKASLSWFKVSQADADKYIAQVSVVPAGDVTLENIMTQKYIALYTQMETWTDWRRTNFPTLKATTGTEIPRRLPSAQAEILYNKDNVPPASISDPTSWKFSKMWWDQ